KDLKKTLSHAKSEEVDHLVWCHDALERLHSNPSIIIPTWFSGALILSIILSITGDEYNALFLEETELQVARHLEKHLQLMPWSDTISLEILNIMLAEEIEHAKNAKSFTNKEMHRSLKTFMQLNAKVMTSLGQYI
ncbi:MAG: demethoxyubiquinone hydroxylase family protein, partial [Gammaproteobacteria bacterium]|nr:demethoxyubiquinone hydroxylase family protein [Gammaproteobacteria bacterium]